LDLGGGLVMPKDDTDSVARALRAAQRTARDAGPAAAAGYTLVGAILALGAAGYGLDVWWGTSPWCLVSGLFLGIAVGFYELIKTTWPR
jgi:F0F1-type ATP synthase assembly protein I